MNIAGVVLGGDTTHRRALSSLGRPATRQGCTYTAAHFMSLGNTTRQPPPHCHVFTESNDSKGLEK